MGAVSCQLSAVNRSGQRVRRFIQGGTDDRFVSSVTQGLRPAKFHEKVGALHLKPTSWQILGRHMFSLSYTGFSTQSSSRALTRHDRPRKAMVCPTIDRRSLKTAWLC